MKFRYVGKESQNLAQVGIVKPNDIIEVTDKQGAALLKNAPEQFKLVKEKAANGRGTEVNDPDSDKAGGES